MTPEGIDSLARTLSDERKPKTVNVLAVLERLLRFSVDRGVLGTMPKVGKLPLPPESVRFLSFGRGRDVIDAARAFPAWTAQVVVALRTGLRIADGESSPASMVNAETGTGVRGLYLIAERAGRRCPSAGTCSATPSPPISSCAARP